MSIVRAEKMQFGATLGGCVTYAELMPASRKVWLPAFGAVMAAAREHAAQQRRVAISQGDAARAAGVTPGTLTRLEQGRTGAPDPVLLWRLSEFYEVPFGAFIAVMEAERRAQRENLPFSFADADDIFRQTINGPSPAVAKAALLEAQAAIWPVLDRLDGLINVDLTPRGQAATPRRRQTDGTTHD